MGVIDKFLPLLMEKEEEGSLTPVFQTSGCAFMYIKHHSLYIVSVSRNNANVTLVFSFLNKIVQVMKEYFKELEEESIRDNFVIIFELLDEMNDFGYPQTTESKILQEYVITLPKPYFVSLLIRDIKHLFPCYYSYRYITQEGHKIETAPKPPPTVTNAVSWRSEGIRYHRNEVFLDVVESVNLLVNYKFFFKHACIITDLCNAQLIFLGFYDW